MPFPKQRWENLPSKTTPLDADRLNLYDNYLFNLSNRTVETINLAEGNAVEGIGTIYRVGFLAQINLTITKVNAVEPFYTMPLGFMPSMNFDGVLIDTDSGKAVTSVSYDRVSNSLSLQSQGGLISPHAKFTMTYICEE